MKTIMRSALILSLLGILGGCIVPVDDGYYYPVSSYQPAYAYGYYPYYGSTSLVINAGGGGRGGWGGGGHHH